MSEGIPGYRAVHWEPLDVISDEVMDRINTNIQLIHDHTPRIRWRSGDLSHNKGIKILTGKKLIPRQNNKSEVAVNVGFGPFFSGGCQPNITTGINSRLMQNVYCTFSGREGAGLTPDNDGFIIHVQIAKEADEKKRIARNIWIHWTAIGY